LIWTNHTTGIDYFTGSLDKFLNRCSTLPAKEKQNI